MVDKKQVLALMDEAEIVTLATIGEKGPRIRALVNLRRQDQFPGPSKLARRDDFTVYLSTSLASDKLREVCANPTVALYYCDAQNFHGVMLEGKVEILDDPELKKALWSPDWRVFWPGGDADPDYVILRISADDVSGWWSGKPFRLEGA